MRGRLGDSDEWRLTLARARSRHNICIWSGDDFSSVVPPPPHQGHICSQREPVISAHSLTEMMMANKKGNLPPACSYSYATLRRDHDGILMDVTL